MAISGKLGQIHYEVSGDGPPLFLVGAPAGMKGFASLAEALNAQFTVARHDPRGIGASTIPPGTPVDHGVLAEDLGSLIAHLSAGPVLLFGASGGAVTALALLERAPQLIDRAVLHEPPLFTLLPEPDSILARADRAFDTALLDPQDAVQQFSDLTEALHSTLVEEPRPAPIKLPPLPQAELEKQRFALGVMARSTVHYRVPQCLASASKLVVAAGEESIGQPARRAAAALAERLRRPLVNAPGNHLAPSTKADLFAAWLKTVFASRELWA